MRRRGVAQPRRKEADSRAFGVQSTRTCLSSTRPCCTAPPRRAGNVAHPPRCPPVRRPDRPACSKPQSRTRSSREATSGHGAVSCGRSACGDAHALGLQRSAALGPPAGARARAGSQPKPGELRSFAASATRRSRSPPHRRAVLASLCGCQKRRLVRSTGRAAVARRQWRDDLKLASTERASQWRAHAARRSARRPDVGTAYLRRRRWTASCSCAPQTSQA